MASAGFLPPDMKPPIPAIVCALAGILFFGAAAHFYVSREAVAAPQPSEKVVPSSTVHIYNAPVTQVLQAESGMKMAQDDRKSGTTFNIHNSPGSIINPSGGQNTITNNNFGPQSRNLDSPWGAPLKAQILKDMPRDKAITVMAVMGDAEGFQLAHQIHAFLKANDFKLAEDGISQGVFSKPIKGLVVEPAGEGKLIFIVGANLP